MQAELIIIGDEILIGQIIDTNSSWISSHLEDIGIQVKQISTIGDSEADIINALTLASSRADVILMTGGLGPTKDDVTKQALSKYFNSDLVFDEAVLEHIEQIFAKYKKSMPIENVKQAEVLRVSEVLFNNAGTAPGMWVKFMEKHFFIMPGVPTEMKYLMTYEVLPRLRSLPQRKSLIKKYILTGGLGESFLADKIRSIEERLPEYIKLAYLPSFAQVRLRLSAVGDDELILNKELDKFSDEIKYCLRDYFINDTDETLELTLLNEMEVSGLSLATAESCTGGLLSHLLTLVPGSSNVFLGGIISYSNVVKENLLSVKQETIEQFGAVSEQTAIEMAIGVKQKLESTYSIAITGIAGPGGGTEEKPVGTVWIAVSGLRETIPFKFSFGKLREDNIIRASKNALLMLLKLVREENQKNKI